MEIDKRAIPAVFMFQPAEFEVVGDRDEQAGAVSMRLLDGSERRAVPLADFVRHVTATVAAKDHASLPPQAPDPSLRQRDCPNHRRRHPPG